METEFNTFHPYPRLPLELKEMIWTKALPSHDSESPQIIRVEAYWSAEAVSEKLRLRKCLARKSSYDTSPEVFELAMTMTCRQSRDVYLKAFPHTLPIRLRGKGNRRIAFIRFKDTAHIRIEQLQQVYYNNSMAHALRSDDTSTALPVWTKNIKHLVIGSNALANGLWEFFAEILTRYFSSTESLLVIGHIVQKSFSWNLNEAIQLYWHTHNLENVMPEIVFADII